LVLALVSNGILIARPGYLALFMIQIALYGMASFGLWTRRFAVSRMLTIPTFFVLANLSILNARYRYASGQRVVSLDAVRPVR
jgi:hypothetical protein